MSGASAKFARKNSQRRKRRGCISAPKHRSYLNLGVFYYQRSKFREGLELCEKALIIFQNTLPAGHPNIKLCEENIEIIKNLMS
ncbi:MAG: tetratricopeptide repeat protein [Acidobacteria bacterium]|nr:tetratricopeptide repeat protein [Acidobacteriota bacterium]